MSNEVDDFLNDTPQSAAKGAKPSAETTVDDFLGSGTDAGAGETVPEASSPVRAVASSALSGVNKAIAHTLGAPSDLLNTIVGRDAFGDTSKRFEELFTSMGLIQPVESPFAERVGETVGSGAAALTPMMGLGSRIPGAIGKGLDLVKQFAARNPAGFMAGEFGSSVTAGLGGATAEVMFPNNPAAEIVGEIGGGLAPGVLAYSPARLVLKGIRATLLTPFTKAGAMARAEKRISEIVPDPDTALANMDQFRGLGLTPAQASDDAGLMALEKAVVRSNRALGMQYEQQAALSNKLLQQNLEDVGDTGSLQSTREFFEARRQYLSSLLDTRTANAVAIAERRIEAARPRMDRQQANIMIRDELDKAYDDALKQEREIWATVPKGVAVDPSTTRSTFENILASRSVAADPKDIPEFLRELVGTTKEVMPGLVEFKPGTVGARADVGDLQVLRSRILHASRKERAEPAPNRQKLGILDDMQEAVLIDLGATNMPEGEVGTAIRTALDFSAGLNAKFRQGTVGQLMGFARRGGPAIDPALTGERNLTRGGEHSRIAMEAMTEAANTPATRGAVEEFYRNLFVSGAVDRNTNKVNPAAAERFLEKHGPVLDQYPQLKASLTDAKQAQRIADDTAKATALEAKSTLRDRQSSRLALFLDAPVDQEIRAVFNSGNPRAAMGELVHMAQADPDRSGEALKGLKTAYVDDLMHRVTQTSFDAEGNPFFSGRRMMKLFRDESSVASQLFTDGEMSNIRRIAAAGAQLEASMATQPLDKIIDDQPSMLIGLAARIVGARAGASVASSTTGSALPAAAAGSRFVRTLVARLSVDKAQRLLVDATQDHELMRALLANASTARRREFVQKRLDAWLVTSGERAFDDGSEQPVE